MKTHLFLHLIAKALLICAIYVTFYSCNRSDKIYLERYEQYYSQSDIFSPEGFFIQEKRKISPFEFIYVAKDQNDIWYSFYLKRVNHSDSTLLLVEDKLKIGMIDYIEYIQYGSYETDKKYRSVIAVEEYDLIELPDPSIKINHLWVLSLEKQKFLQKNPEKYYRVHEGYYLRRD